MRLFLIENSDETLWPQGPDGAPAASGSCARCPLESHHILDASGRGPCWMVRLPGDGHWWHTNMKSTDEPQAYWTVTGEAPGLTVTPSINIGPEWWHGWITDGVLSPDSDHNNDFGPYPVEQWIESEDSQGRSIKRSPPRGTPR